MDAFIGTILPVGFSFPPRGWMLCNGQLLSISSNTALFALLGTQYGGDGVNTFALPDLRGRTLVGQSLGMTGRIDNTIPGSAGGTPASTVVATGAATVALTVPNLPPHNHNATFTAGSAPFKVSINASTDSGTSAEPLADGYLGTGTTDGALIPYLYSATASGTVKLNAATATVEPGTGTISVSNTGTGTPLQAPVSVSAIVNTTPPYLGINYIICISGFFPSRN